MPQERNNKLLVKLATEVVNNLEKHNSSDSRRTRIEFALDNTYSKQLNRIEELIDELAQ